MYIGNTKLEAIYRLLKSKLSFTESHENERFMFRGLGKYPLTEIPLIFGKMVIVSQFLIHFIIDVMFHPLSFLMLHYLTF